MWVAGAFIRSESGNVLPANNHRGEFMANVPAASRKDVRDAVSAGRKAAAVWAARSATNRGQIVFRLAEMLEPRAAELAALLVETTGVTQEAARDDVAAAVDLVFSWAGWCDKIGAIFGTNNPVSGAIDNRSTVQPTGLVAALAGSTATLSAWMLAVLPALCSGNAVLMAVPVEAAILSTTLAEVFAVSDLPPGVLAILTGLQNELVGHISAHPDVDVIAVSKHESELLTAAQRGAAASIMRVATIPDAAGLAPTSPWRAESFLETKTTWHPRHLP
jgi:acyl-CoA reductase-like NAD-dependent aldehyde dehydrogenase